MILLQLDMLAYEDKSAQQPGIVIGAGLPEDWLKHPMAVRGLPMTTGRLDWSWNAKEMRVTLSGPDADVRLGSNFPGGTPLKVDRVTRQ